MLFVLIALGILLVVGLLYAASRAPDASGNAVEEVAVTPSPSDATARLLTDIKAGRPLPALDVPFALRAGEKCVGIADGGLDLWVPSHAYRDPVDRWRDCGRYRFYVTSQRIAVAGNPSSWHDIWFGGVRTVEFDDVSVKIRIADEPAARLRVSPPDYWFVLVHFLAFGRSGEIAPPAD